MTITGYQLQFHHGVQSESYDLGHLLHQLRDHLPQTPYLPARTQVIEFESIYCKLDDVAARLLRSLGLLPNGFSPAIAAVLLDCDLNTATRTLQQLMNARLIDRLSQTWYCFAEDQIRQQARRKLVTEDSIELRQKARSSLVRWYLELCQQMNLCLDPAIRFQIALAARKGDSFVSTLFSANHSNQRSESIAQSLFLFVLDWFEGEKANLLQCIEWSHQANDWLMTVQLTQTLVRFFDLKADWQHWEQTHLLALEAANLLNDRAQEAQILNSLANAYTRQGDWKKARVRYDRALAICTEQALTAQEAQTLMNLGIVSQLQNRDDLGFWQSAIERLPPGSLEREKVGNWMRSTSRLPLQTALEELGTSANSHQILHAVGGAIKWLLNPGGLSLFFGSVLN